MNNKKKRILVNLLVICLYFIWPYFLNSITGLFKLSEVPYLYISFGANFIFLFVVIYIYKETLKKYIKELKKDLKNNLLSSLKIFGIGLLIFFVCNALLYSLGVPYNNNTSSMISIFEKIPLMFILNTLFYYPIIEEIVFKMSVKKVISNKWSFIIVTGFLNAFFQIVFSITNATDLLYLLPYTIFFGSLSFIYYKSDNILLPIFLRICYNVIPCITYIIETFY